MRIEVQLFATLLPYLPPGGRGGTGFIEIPDGATVDEAVRRLGIPLDLARIALVNGHDATPDDRLAAGDVLTLFPPLAGGRGRPPD